MYCMANCSKEHTVYAAIGGSTHAKKLKGPKLPKCNQGGLHFLTDFDCFLARPFRFYTSDARSSEKRGLK